MFGLCIQDTPYSFTRHPSTQSGLFLPVALHQAPRCVDFLPDPLTTTTFRLNEKVDLNCYLSKKCFGAYNK